MMPSVPTASKDRLTAGERRVVRTEREASKYERRELGIASILLPPSGSPDVTGGTENWLWVLAKRVSPNAINCYQLW
jgi:hypothetical protein